MTSDVSEKSPWIVNTTDESFDLDVLERSRTVPVVVDFWAAWCQPCRLLAPSLEQLAREFDGRFILAKADTEQTPQAAARFGVQSIPAVFGVRDGQPVDYFVGLLPPESIRQWIERLLPTPAELLVSEANRLTAENPAEAEAKFREAIQLDPQYVAAQTGLAELLLAQGRVADARAIIDELARRGYLEPAAERVRAALELQEQGAAAGDLATLRAEAEANPKDWPAQLKLAQALAAAGQHKEALDAALRLVEYDRRATGEQARLLMLDIFRLLPDDSELTSEYRRKLSSALY